MQVPAIDVSSEDGVVPEVLEGNVDFKDISFTYPSRSDIQVQNKFLSSIRLSFIKNGVDFCFSISLEKLNADYYFT